MLFAALLALVDQIEFVRVGAFDVNSRHEAMAGVGAVTGGIVDMFGGKAGGAVVAEGGWGRGIRVVTAFTNKSLVARD